MNSTALGLLFLLAATTLVAPRRWAALSFVAGAIYLTQYQAIDAFGFNLTSIRILELVGVLRLIVRREYRAVRGSPLDSALLWLYVATSAIFLIRSDMHHAEMVGSLIDAMLCYGIFRSLIIETEELEWFIKALAVLLVPFVVLLTVEMLTWHNPFSAFGAEVRADLRDGRPRAMGSFRNPSSLGTLGACLLPLYIGLYLIGRNRLLTILGILVCLAIVGLANAGGPVMAVAAGCVGWACWWIRRSMKLVRWGLVGGVALLALVMKAPVWYLLARASSVSGGDGWHRARLIDMAIRNMDRWWLVGMDLEHTSGWFPYVLGITGAADITNNFVLFGLNGGLIALILLITLLVRGFRALGIALAHTRADLGERGTEYLLWGLGCALLVHVVTWMNITYFDQIYVIWFLQLASIASITTAVQAGATAAGDPARQLAGRRPHVVESPASPLVVRRPGVGVRLRSKSRVPKNIVR